MNFESRVKIKSVEGQESIEAIENGKMENKKKAPKGALIFFKDQLCDCVFVLVSPFFLPLRLACAAASLAIGTLNGEQLT